MNNTVTVESKSYLTSKLTWLGIVELLLGLLGIVKDFLSSQPAADVVGLVGPVKVSPEVDSIVLAVIGLLTIWWRKRTTRPVSATKKLVQIPKLATEPTLGD